MQNDQNMEQGELSNISNTEKETDKSPLYTHEEIKNTPFHISGNDEKGYFIRMGGYKLTEERSTPREAEKLLTSHRWHIILTMMAAIEHANGRGRVTIK